MWFSSLKDLGDEGLSAHLLQSRNGATYVSTTSTDEFVTCLSIFLEEGFLSEITAVLEFCLLSDATTDIADRGELAILICYADSDCQQVEEGFLVLVEVVASKGAEVLCQITWKMFKEKGVDIYQLRFNSYDDTNTMMSGEI